MFSSMATRIMLVTSLMLPQEMSVLGQGYNLGDTCSYKEETIVRKSSTLKPL